ncbi:Frag1/DRAM/Sfk1 family-domain-containing protein [Irpex rosettiformis]|uniref:Frag1/DRAM/Sfk1 family-domain-containing protein n=1 Tax=Irpex rosettiformis TaxID=378272 RepID=A0ACB8U6Z1_9APHY|nr:Frag1/DRAM/Sfk1 family-domain-containing protein [Irpex rosettiformis]
MPRAHQHWLYVWIPLVAATVWFGTLLAMLITWLAQGRPHYVSQDGSIAYISDVGADILKPLFITGCSITAVGFFLSLVVERWLRHSGRLIPQMRRRERALAILAIIGSFIGGAGLILLSVFDTKRYSSAHSAFLLVFIVGVGLSAIFTVIEYRWISKDFEELRKLKFAYILKGTIATILILCAIAFAIALFNATDVGAILEWIIAFGYTFYLLTFFLDLRMAKGVHRGQFKRSEIKQAKMQGVPVSVMAARHEGDFVLQGGYSRESNDTSRTYNGRAPLLPESAYQPGPLRNAYVTSGGAANRV